MSSIDLIYVLIEEIKKNIKEEVKRELRAELRASIKNEIIRDLKADSMELDQQYDEIMNVDQAVLYLKTSKSTVFRMTKSKEIPSYKMGQRRFIKKCDLDRYIEGKIKEGITK
ncbi:helix-turn-helix domain-containing protein [Paenibacillus lutimineralis]|uniref:Helix-turn-helix domain-containing protein n=1 Tax=Paenibacillus lutimineralis TaxID=2707005 RepID=A0A3S9UW60_9BACL|nr:excisionase family DNA-binding protein [Paenibacillus lutimineralis]AZS14564.1 helix-turn-helix domain-containing protein [Paenibacillus lutimineralis]